MPEVQLGRAELPATARGPLYNLDGKVPRVHSTAFVAPTAAVIGDVEIGPECGIWFACVVRGDTNIIRIGARSNVQDGTVVHVDAATFATHIGDDVTIGHGAIIHACTLKNRAFIGMGSIVLDGAVVEEGGVLGAGGLLTPGKVIGRYELWTGSPARLKRVMDEDERRKFDRNAAEYRELAARYRAGFAAA